MPGKLIFSAYPYYVEQVGSKYYLTVQSDRIGTDMVLDFDDKQVAVDFAKLLQFIRVTPEPGGLVFEKPR